MPTNKLKVGFNSRVDSKTSLCTNTDSSGENESGAIKKHGMGTLVAILFIAGENAGCGVLALPFSFDRTGWSGLPLLIMCWIDAGICGILIGKCWLILEERWPKFRESCRNPYAAIGESAFGSWMKTVVSICLQTSLLGSAVVILLICAELVSEFASQYCHVPFGLWILLVAAALLPFMMLGSPGEMWPVAAGALFTITTAIVLIMVDATKAFINADAKPAPTSLPSVSTVSLAFGTFIFAFGGTAIFPNYQNDMKDKSKFPKAVMVGYLILIILYVPIAVIGYLAYGSSVKNNIISSIPNGIKKDAAILLLSGHLFFAFLIVVNGAILEIENKLKIPTAFGWKRFVVRTSTLILVLFISESIPHFGKILDLMGGSAITMLCYILPPLFYMKLCSMKNDYWPEWKVSTFEKIYYYKIALVGTIGGISCTFWALKAIFAPDAFSLPCYIDINCLMSEKR